VANGGGARACRLGRGGPTALQVDIGGAEVPMLKHFISHRRTELKCARFIGEAVQIKPYMHE
jgi:hypothetical protein